MNPQRETIIRITKLLLGLLVLCGALLLLTKGTLVPGIAQAPDEESLKERVIDDLIPKHVPIKIKLKKEKEKGFKDLKNGNWAREFELEVTNTSNKPIYFLELWLIFPEIIEANGGPVGIPLRYGRTDFIRSGTLATKDDVPIGPGETHTYTIPEKYQSGWYAHRARGYMSDPTKVLLQFVQLSFGDGTGFHRTDAKPYANKKEQSSSGRCENQNKLLAMKENPKSPLGFPDLFTRTSVQIKTGNVHAGYFFPPSQQR
jgi:hypothetical protein